MRNLSLFEKIVSYNITPSDYYLLLCIASVKEVKIINSHQSLRSLRSEKLVKEKTLELTDKGKNIIESIEGIFIGKENTKDYIKEYIEIFPNLRLPSGKLARSNYRDVEESFHWFFRNYKHYTWDIVIKATKVYVREYELKNYHYMRTSKYFIKKADSTRTSSSELADYCARVASKSYIDSDNDNFKESVT